MHQTETEARTPGQTGSRRAAGWGGWTEEGEGINKKRPCVTRGHGPRCGDGRGRAGRTWAKGENRGNYSCNSANNQNRVNNRKTWMWRERNTSPRGEEQVGRRQVSHQKPQTHGILQVHVARPSDGDRDGGGDERCHRRRPEHRQTSGEMCRFTLTVEAVAPTPALDTSTEN